MKLHTNLILKQLENLENLSGSMRLAADNWNSKYKTLIATMLSAQTMDETTIPVSTKLFKKYPKINDLADANLTDVESVIKSINYYKTKSKHIIATSKIIIENFKGKIPMDFDKLILLPGVGNKTANVFLSVYGIPAIAVDTHVHYISNFLLWSNKTDPKKVQIDLENQFPKNKWSSLNPILVRFGKKYTSKKEKDKLLLKIKSINYLL